MYRVDRLIPGRMFSSLFVSDKSVGLYWVELSVGGKCFARLLLYHLSYHGLVVGVY